jgi:oligopeptide transport system permease protein
MKGRILRRILSLAVGILLVHAGAFLMVRSTRGGPFDEERSLSPQVRQALEARYGLDEPLPLQYLHALGGLLRGDFGPSLRYRDTQVSELLADALPISLALGGGALLLALLAGIPVGLLAASRRHPIRATLAGGVSTLLLALPNFVLAGLLVAVFSFHLGWLPPAGFGSFRHLLLPWLCLALPLGAQIALLVRARTRETLDSAAVRCAVAQGLPPRLLWSRHVLRPSLTPVLAFLGPATAALLTGSLVIEQVFALPGLGTFFVQAALARDYTLALGVTVVYTALLGSCTLVADLLMARLDPRVEALS